MEYSHRQSLIQHFFVPGFSFDDGDDELDFGFIDRFFIISTVFSRYRPFLINRQIPQPVSSSKNTSTKKSTP